MSISYIVNATPLMVEQGVDDKSGSIVAPAPIPLPQHLPKVYLRTKKGPTTPQLAMGALVALMYGQESFDPISAFYNHSTSYANTFTSEGNAMMVHRLVPADAATSGIRISLLVKTTPLANPVARNTDGTINTGTNETFTVPNSISYIVTKEPIPLTGETFGLATVAVDTNGNTKYPLFDIPASSPGAYGNAAGVRLYPGQLDTAPSNFISKARTFPYYVSTVAKPNSTTSPQIVKNLFGENSTIFTLKPNSTDSLTGVANNINDAIPGKFQNTTDPSYPLSFSDFGKIFTYDAQIDFISSTMLTAELEALNTFVLNDNGTNGYAGLPSLFDWGSDATIGIAAAGYVTTPTAINNNEFLVNLLTAKSSTGLDYLAISVDPTIVPVVGSNELGVPISNVTNIMLIDGSDGTLDVPTFETDVTVEMAKYLDPNSTLQDTAINPESILWDSGFSLINKKELCSFISQRKDTFVVLATYDPTATETAGGTLPMSNTSDYNNALVLKTRLQLYPESSSFGTPVMRGMVVGQSAELKSSTYGLRVPLSIELAKKAAAYMGAGTGKWKPGYSFDTAPGNIVASVKDIQPSFIPASSKFMMWDAGLVWAQPYDLRSFFIPATQTVYENDTSVLNTFITALAICTLNKVAWKAWRKFTNTSNLSDGQLADAVNKFVEADVADRFDGRYKIVSDTIITAADEARGYSWTLVIKIGAGVAKTVMTTKVEAYNIANL